MDIPHRANHVENAATEEVAQFLALHREGLAFLAQLMPQPPLEPVNQRLARGPRQELAARLAGGLARPLVRVVLRVILRPLLVLPSVPGREVEPLRPEVLAPLVGPVLALVVHGVVRVFATVLRLGDLLALLWGRERADPPFEARPLPGQLD